jgi:integrase
MTKESEIEAKIPDLEEENEAPEGKTTIPSVLSYDEIDRFLLSIEGLTTLLAARLMLFAGLRVGEVVSLLVKDVDLDRRAVFVRQGKGGKDRWAPLDIGTLSFANAIIGPWEKDSPIFKESKRTLQRHMERQFLKAGITWGATCHTLRHTCATWQLDKGVPLEVVRENLGHESIEVTQIYLHLNIRQRSRIYQEAVRFGL